MKNAMNLIGLLALAGSLSTAPAAFAQADAGAAAPTPPAAAPAAAPAAPTVDELLAKVDALQPTRDDAASQKQIEALLSQAKKLAPNDYGVLWRVARNHCWIGEGFAGEKQAMRRQVEAKQCWDYGARAVKAQPDKVEGNYFAANGAGNYSTEIGIMKALTHGMEGTFNGFLDKAIAIDPGFKGAAPLVAKGRYYFSLPWPKRSYSKSEEMFKKALALQPKAIRAKLWLAETLVNDGNAKEAKIYLDQVEAQLAKGGEGFDPPEVRRVKGWVGPVKEKIQEELK